LTAGADNVDVNGDPLIPGARSLDRVFKERMFAKSGGVAEALRVELSREAIADFCRRWHIRELAISGSALREDFRPDSDVDVSVTFEELEMAYEWRPCSAARWTWLSDAWSSRAKTISVANIF